MRFYYTIDEEDHELSEIDYVDLVKFEEFPKTPEDAESVAIEVVAWSDLIDGDAEDQSFDVRLFESESDPNPKWIVSVEIQWTESVTARATNSKPDVARGQIGFAFLLEDIANRISQKAPEATSGQWPERQEFARWWRETGSGIAPEPGEDHATHMARLAEIAWCAATRQSRAADVYRTALQKACGHIVACDVHEVSCDIATDGRVGQCMQEFVEWAEDEIKGSGTHE